MFFASNINHSKLTVVKIVIKMNILIVAATQFEVQPLLDFLEINYSALGMQNPVKTFHNKQIQVLVTGVGMVNTAFMMGNCANKAYDLIINVGVAGAFDKNLQMGQLVEITKDCLSELGAENDAEFLTYDQLNLGGTHVFSNRMTDTFEKLNDLQKVAGITVNTIHGNDASIEKVKQLYNPSIESMEGAAFFATCLNKNQYTQIRAISNYVEKRNKSKWNMPLAIKNLNEFLISFIEGI
jgi:futalosine hydrolase